MADAILSQLILLALLLPCPLDAGWTKELETQTPEAAKDVTPGEKAAEKDKV